MPQNGRLAPGELGPIAQGQLRRDAAAAWNAMNVESRKHGLQLVPTGSASSYRTYEQQVQRWNLYQSGKGALAAHPGSSNHGWGVAVDVPTQEMRSMIDRIGAPFGWSKTWSDAPTEWWHIKFQEGHYAGADPGPYGQQPASLADAYLPVGESVAQNADGRLEMFQDRAGSVWHVWQTAPNGKWSSWAPFGKP
jgi:hypothetical protein